MLKKPSLVIIGHVGHDTVVLGGEEKSRHVAGSAFYSSLGAACVTRDTGLVTRIHRGDSDVKNALFRLGIDLAGVHHVSAHSPEFTVRYRIGSNPNQRDLEREVVMNWGCGLEIVYADIPQHFLAAPCFHISTAPPVQQLEWLTGLRNNARTSGIVGVDTVEDFIRADPATLCKVFELADVIFLNHRELSALDPSLLANKNIVAKRGELGAELLLAGRTTPIRVAAPTVSFADSTGSGDILAGSFLAAVALGYAYENALSLSVKLASASVTGFGVEHMYPLLSRSHL